uniref:Uncharacterized protein n=1 Tax=Setaria digitata TaxID=48799 RepID=A0A915PYC7_9BILA
MHLNERALRQTNRSQVIVDGFEHTLLEESNDDEEYDTIVRKILDEIDILECAGRNRTCSCRWYHKFLARSSTAAIKPLNKLANADLEKLLSELKS